MANYGTKPFLLGQFGAEATAGTPVTPTQIWRGTFPTWTDDRTREVVEEDIGLLAPMGRMYDSMLRGKLEMAATPMTFEQLPYLFEAGINAVTPSGTPNYTRTYSLPTSTTLNAPKPRTWVLGNRQVSSDVIQIPYAFPSEIVLEGKQNEAWMMSANWFGQRIMAGTFAALTPGSAIEDAMFSNTKLYIDAGDGTIGTTQKTGVLLAAQVRIETGIVPVPVGDGTLYYTAHKFKRPVVSYSLTLELESTSVVAAERAAYDSKTVRLIRLEATGSGSKKITLDFAGKHLSVGAYSDEDDEDQSVTFEGQAFYSSADALWLTAAIVNSVATL